jgi:hypothetical protein
MSRIDGALRACPNLRGYLMDMVEDATSEKQARLGKKTRRDDLGGSRGVAGLG